MGFVWIRKTENILRRQYKPLLTTTLEKWFWGGLFLLKFGRKFGYNLCSDFMTFRFDLVYGNSTPKITWKVIKDMIDFGYWAHNMQRKK